ncbi:MAG TPA: hypothetical protein VFM48_03980, partial [Aquabacterium sp.]|nr:hypothetical protein [Aquabacterium sp.]
KLDHATLEQGLNQSTKETPESIRQLAKIFGTDSSAEPPSTPSPRVTTMPPNTSPLFRQAVVDQYTNNMYAEDVS